MSLTLTSLSCAWEGNPRRTGKTVRLAPGCAWRVDLYRTCFFEVKKGLAVVFDDVWSPIVVLVVDFFSGENLASERGYEFVFELHQG